MTITESAANGNGNPRLIDEALMNALVDLPIWNGPGAEEIHEPTARAQYNTLKRKREDLQAEKVECDIAFRQFVLDPSLYTDEQIHRYRERYPLLTAELESVANEIDFLFFRHPELREQLEREARGNNGGSGHHPNGTRNHGPVLESYTADSLALKTFPEPKFAVPELLPEGLNFLAGAPKLGKSFLALNIGLAVAAGGRALGSISVAQGDVLYLALEDTPRRMQTRIHTLFDPDPFPARLHLVHNSPKLSQGLESAISDWLVTHPEARLVIVDTLARVRKQRGKNADSYIEDSQAAEQLQRIAFQHSVCVLVLHHIRKAEALDPLEMVSGTFGLTGGADAVLVLKRSRGQTDATLNITGRDIEEKELALNFMNGAWDLIGDAAEYALSKTRLEVIQLLRQSKEPLRPKIIAAELGRSETSLKMLLSSMLDDGQVIQTDRGFYTVPGQRK